MKSTALVALVFSLVGFMPTIGQTEEGSNLCPQIDCDCSTLPQPAWQDTCRSHEYTIKSNCVKNNNTPRDFCALHGPRAHPLPLVAEYPEVKVIPQEEIKGRHEKSKVFYETLHKEVDAIKRKMSALDFKGALQVVKLMDSHQGKLFFEERVLTASWFVYGEHDDATSAWKDYGKLSMPLADEMTAYGKELWTKYQTEVNANKQKAYKVLAFKILRLAGKEYEMAGHAYGGANRNKDAAAAWLQGAEVSKVLLSAKQESKADPSHVTFYRYQAASRLHRASYYYGIDQRKSDALEALSIAQEISPSGGLDDLIASENSQMEKGGLLELVQ